MYLIISWLWLPYNALLYFSRFFFAITRMQLEQCNNDLQKVEHDVTRKITNQLLRTPATHGHIKYHANYLVMRTHSFLSMFLYTCIMYLSLYWSKVISFNWAPESYQWKLVMSLWWSSILQVHWQVCSNEHLCKLMSDNPVCSWKSYARSV